MIIKINDLTKIYDKNFKALKNINLTISNGMFGLLGPNGAGKTTLMRILTTILKPTSGRVKIGDYDINHNQREIREILGYLPQEFGLYKKLTAREYLDYAGVLKGITDSKERRKQIGILLEEVNLEQVAKKRISTYSGGMKQRLGIAQALLGEPRLLIVDEPTTGLDPEERIRFRNLLSKLSKDRIVILSTHIVADVESSCNDLAVLKEGEIIFHGNPSKLLTLAKDTVWQVEITSEVFNETSIPGRILSTRRTQLGFSLRVISHTRPTPWSIPIEPSLEDGYMVLMEKGGCFNV